MKQIFIILLIFSCLLISACNNSTSIGTIGSQDGPTSVIVSYDDKISDKWGISLSAKNITCKGMTILFKQSGGLHTRELSVGSEYSLEVMNDGIWEAVETIINDYAWTALGYSIKNNDTTEFDINWEWLYGELPPGQYKLKKEIMNFRAAGDFDKELYELYFNIK